MEGSRHGPFLSAPRGPFNLNAAISFLGGFTPAARPDARDQEHLHLAFCTEEGYLPVGACVTQAKPGDDVSIEVFGDAAPALVVEQVQRILSLDVDGSGFAEVGRRDPVVGDLQQRFDWLRPVNFWSSWEAAVWAILSQRITMRQAAGIKARMAEELGTAIDIHGDRQVAFPGPAALDRLDSFPGVVARKIPYLQAAARAALEGRLSSARLRALPEEEALQELTSLPGIGPMSSLHVLVRGAGSPDMVTPIEPRLPRAIAHAYGLDHVPDDAEVRRIAEAWRPYRTWVMVLLRVAFARDRPEDNARRR